MVEDCPANDGREGGMGSVWEGGVVASMAAARSPIYDQMHPCSAQDGPNQGP